jgi:hypothetical protein
MVCAKNFSLFSRYVCIIIINHMLFTHVPPDFRSPEGFTGTTHSIVSAGVIREMARRHGLAEPGLRGLDPACGSYMIPRVLRMMGAHIDAADIERSHCESAQIEAGYLNAQRKGLGTVVCASMTELQPAEPYDYIYTSLPFDWFKTEAMPDPRYAQALVRLIRPGGLIIIYSAETAMRGVEEIPVASRQVAYLTSHPAVNLVATHQFYTAPREGYDQQFTELVLATAA